MRVKRYVVNSMPDALQIIREDMGKDAIILNTKHIRSGGLLGFFGKKKIEVIAAVDSVRAQPSSQPFSSPNLNTRPVINPSGTRQEIAPLLPDGNRTLNTFKETPVSVTKGIYEPPRDTNIAAKLSQPVREAGEDPVLKELQEFRSMFFKIIGSNAGNRHAHPVLQQIIDRLQHQEVEEEIIAEIIKQLTEKWDDLSVIDDAMIWREAKQVIVSMIEKRGKPATIESLGKRVISFIGPTGVGKTTTIAKLASEFVLKERSRVGFITSDTYRIAAVDQLKIYANILNAPLEVVFTADDFEKALINLKSCDLILMDTAGRNYLNDIYCKEMNVVLDRASPSDMYLVLSLTAKYQDMEKIIQNFSHLSIDKVIFTKSDETTSYGAILNTVYRHNMSLSYLTHGQSVPEDISLACTDSIAKLILGVDDHE